MPTPSSGNSISFLDIVNEFGLPTGKNLGAYRISQNVGTLTNLPLDEGIPQSVSIGSSSIRFSDFYNKRLNVVVDYTGFPSSVQEIRTLLPTEVLTATNLNANINNLDEGVDNFNNVYATNTGLAQNTLLRLGLPNLPNTTLLSGDDLQTFRARVRKNASGGNATTVRLEVRQNNVLLANSSNFTITSTTGQNISFTWNASILNSLEGQNVELVVAQQSGGTGTNVSNRRWIETDAADWISNVIAFFGRVNARQVYSEGIYNVVIGGTQNNIAKGYPLDPTQAYKIIINVNTILGSRKGEITNCAFRTGDWRTSTGDSLTIVKLELGPNAEIYGAGGDGGSSNDNYTNDNVPDSNPNAAGQNGTSALGIDYPTTVVNRGRIQAGGGGGGGGGGELYRVGKSNRRSSGGGGGGGAGYRVSERGLASGTSSGQAGTSGSNGQRGTFQTAGAGGAGGTNAGDGGNGGGLAVNGSPGEDSSDQLGGAGGLAGYAVVISSFAAPLTPPIQNLVDGVILGSQTIATPTT